MQPLASIPSPAEGVWHLGPVPLRAYALMIIVGIVVAVWVGERRWAAKGGTPGVVIDVAVWAVPFGLVGGRLYHVITDYQRYFGEGGDPVGALEIWNGGLGIWGAVALGGVGAWIGCRRRGVSVAALGDAIAPGIALAQAIGRWGNWWNQELFGRPLDAWWGLEIDPEHRPEGYADVATFHPTFLYESLWCVGVAVLVIWADKRYKLTHGRAFALYLAAYTVGRFWIEWLRIDDAHEVLGLRLNDWTSLLVFAGAVAYLYRTRAKTGPEAVVVTGIETEPAIAEETEEAKDPDSREKVAAGKVSAPEERTADETASPVKPATAAAAAGAATAATADKPATTEEPVSGESAAADEPSTTEDSAAEEPAAAAGAATADDLDAAEEPTAAETAAPGETAEEAEAVEPTRDAAVEDDDTVSGAAPAPVDGVEPEAAADAEDATPDDAAEPAVGAGAGAEPAPGATAADDGEPEAVAVPEGAGSEEGRSGAETAGGEEAIGKGGSAPGESDVEDGKDGKDAGDKKER